MSDNSSLFRDDSALQRMAASITDELLSGSVIGSRYGARGRQHCLDDTVYHLTYLGQAVEFGDPKLFEDYIAWARVMLASRGIEPTDLLANVEQIRATLFREANREAVLPAIGVVEYVLAKMPHMPDAVDSLMQGLGDHEPAARAYLDALRAAKRHQADAVLERSLIDGASIPDLYLGVFEPVQHEIGRLWQMNQISVAQEHFCTAAVQRSMSQLYPRLFSGAPGRRRVVAACAGGELHEIGLRMVTDLLEADGWDTVYLGANVPAQSIVRTVAEAPTALVAISTTITPHLQELTSLVAALRANPATAGVPIIVGGYPFRLSRSIVERLRVDGWAPNATEAVRLANELVPRR